MTLIPWRNKRQGGTGQELTPASPIGQLRTEMERLFDRFFRDPLRLSDEFFGDLSIWGPPLDVAETEDEITVRMEIPGVDPKDFDISISGNVLTLSGRKRESRERKGVNYYHSERRLGAFRRTLPLPATVDPDKVTAEYVHGVLTVRLHKQPSARPKRIPLAGPKK